MVNLPKVIKFDDYHEIDYVGNHIRTIVPGLKVAELSTDLHGREGCYFGLFYIGNRPANDKIMELVADACRPSRRR